MNIQDLSKLSKNDLLAKCKYLNISKYSSKNKNDLIIMIIKHLSSQTELIVTKDEVQQLKFIDLFCGIGGFHQALIKLNGKCVFSCDIDESCRNIYEQNYGLKPAGDITKIQIDKIPEFDILCGGFPCFIEGTKVLTNSGYKNIEDIILTDKLLTHTGKFQSILNLQTKKYNGDLYVLNTKYHYENITCTEEHPFYVRERKSKWNNNLKKYDYFFEKPEWKLAKNLTLNDYYGMIINTNNIIPEFNYIDDEQYKRHIPEFVHDAPKEFIKEFINRYKELNDLDLSLALGLQRLYLKLGYIYSINKGFLEEEKNISSFIEDNYAWFAPSNIIKKEIKDISVYNFEVENDNSYIVQNTIVHNCQPFSKAGFQKGFEDDRGNLFFNICNIIKHHRPKYLLLENVRNLSSHDDGNTWKVIRENIDKLGYYTYQEPVILNVLHFNIPQNRERVIIMCKRKDLGELNELPVIPSNPKVFLTNSIKDVIRENEKETNDKYKISGKMKDVERIWDEFIKLLISEGIQIPKFPIWTDWWDNDINSDKDFYKKYTSWIDKNREFYNINKDLLQKWLESSRNCINWVGAVRKFEWQAGDVLENDGMNNVLWTPRGSGIRVKRLNYIPTLVAMGMIPVYGPESRKLTPRELLRLQSFPDTFNYNDKTIFKQVGNSVNVKMIEKCAKFLIFNESLF